MAGSGRARPSARSSPASLAAETHRKKITRRLGPTHSAEASGLIASQTRALGSAQRVSRGYNGAAASRCPTPAEHHSLAPGS